MPEKQHYFKSTQTNELSNVDDWLKIQEINFDVMNRSAFWKKQRNHMKYSTQQQAFINQQSRQCLKSEPPSQKQKGNMIAKNSNENESISELKIDQKSSQQFARLPQMSPDYELNVTNQQVKYGLNLLKGALPKISVSKVVKALYNGLMKKYNAQQKTTLSNERNSPENPRKYTHRRAHLLNLTKTYLKDDSREFKYPKPFSQLRRKKTCFVAYTIFSKDYGAAAFDEALQSIKEKSFLIERKQYKVLAESVAAQTFRAIQRFLTKDCQQPILIIQRSQLRTIFRVILNFRSYFEKENIAIILKFISSIYGFSDVTIAGHEAMKLYRVLEQKLRSKRMEKIIQPNGLNEPRKMYRFKGKEHSKFYKIDQIWNYQLEKQLLELYRVDHSISNLRAQLIYIHPELQAFIENAALRSKFETSIRKTIFKMKHAIERTFTSLPELTKISDQRTKCMQRSHEALDLRIKLIDFYLKEYSEIEMKEELKELILCVNQFIASMERSKGNLQEEAPSDPSSIKPQPVRQHKLTKVRHQRYQIKLGEVSDDDNLSYYFKQGNSVSCNENDVINF